MTYTEAYQDEKTYFTSEVSPADFECSHMNGIRINTNDLEIIDAAIEILKEDVIHTFNSGDNDTAIGYIKQLKTLEKAKKQFKQSLMKSISEEANKDD